MIALLSVAMIGLVVAAYAKHRAQTWTPPDPARPHPGAAPDGVA